MSKPRYISTYLILSLLMISVIAPIISILYSQQQIIVAQIIDVEHSIVYPGETAKVKVAVFFGGVTITVRLTNASMGPAWSERSLHALSPGEYEVLVPLPEKLPGARDTIDPIGLVDLVVEVWAIGQRQDHRNISVGPKIVVTPPVSTIVDPYGNPSNVTVNFYGFVPGTTISELRFINKVSQEPYDYDIEDVVIGGDASSSTEVSLYVSGFLGLPKGEYYVNCSATGTNIDYLRPGSLRIEPQVVISPTESHGRCELRTGGECETTGLTIKGYGFDAGLSIVSLKLLNINFTNVYYNVPVQAQVDDRGNFEASTNGFKTNMTAGLYIPEVKLAPAPQDFANDTTINLNTRGWVAITPGATEPALGVKVLINATSYVKGTLGYIPKYTNDSFTLTEVLKINIPIGNKIYQLAANRDNDGTVWFVLYNLTTLPPIVLSLVNITSDQQTYNATLGAYVANVSFNIAPDQMHPNVPSIPGEYGYWATFYTYPNKIVLLLREYGLYVEDANLTIVYRRDTVIKSYYYVYPQNMTVTGFTISIPAAISLTDTDANIDWSINWRYNASNRMAIITARATPKEGPTYRFTNVYHIVRPLLVIVAPVGQVIKPGDKVTVAAYGYGPGYDWGYGDNTLTVYWEKAQKLTEVSLGKDGNKTFDIVIPSDATYGVHYLWGVDKWSYEYSLAIIIGAKAYWEKVVDDPRLIIDPTTNKVSAGYKDERFVVCPCPESENVVAVKYCGVCAVYAARCDYLGDKIRVTLSGLYPGERIDIYFADKKVKTIKANSSVETTDFVVPTLRAGTYTIYAVGSVSGYISIDLFYNTTDFISVSPVVVPKILVLDLQRNYVPILVGPGLVRVIGTGFAPGVAVEAVLFNGTDAMVKFNEHVTKWYSDDKGVLSSPYTDVLGIYVPALEPGAYEVKLVYFAGPVAQREYSMPSYVFVINNMSIVSTKHDIDKLRTVLMNRLAEIETAVGAARDAASRAESAVAALRKWLETNIDELKNSIADLGKSVATKSDVDSVSKKVDALATKISEVGSVIDRIDKAVADLGKSVATKSDVDSVSKKVDALATALDEGVKKLDEVSRIVKELKDVIPVDQISEISANVKSATEALQKARDDITQIRNDISSLRTDVTGLKTDVSAIKSDAGRISAIDSSVKSLEDSVGTIRTLVIIALVFAVVAAAAAIYATISISRALAK